MGMEKGSMPFDPDSVVGGHAKCRGQATDGGWGPLRLMGRHAEKAVGRSSIRARSGMAPGPVILILFAGSHLGIVPSCSFPLLHARLLDVAFALYAKAGTKSFRKVHMQVHGPAPRLVQGQPPTSPQNNGNRAANGRG